MLVDFNSIPEQHLPNFKGGEIEYCAKMFTDEHNKIMQGLLVPGASIGFHKHTEDCEIIYVLEGHGTMIGDDGIEKLPVNPGETHYCPKGQSHSLVNTGTEDLKFFAVVARV